MADIRNLKGIILDDADAQKIGHWTESFLTEARRVGTGYIHDSNANKGEVSLTYTPNLPRAGEYEIILISPPNPNRATQVPVTIATQDGQSKTMRVNQRTAANKGFSSLGKFRLPAGRKTTVTISNKDTDGFVVADGIQFVPVE